VTIRQTKIQQKQMVVLVAQKSGNVWEAAEIRQQHTPNAPSPTELSTATVDEPHMAVTASEARFG
jgi:hypothetical protein